MLRRKTLKTLPELRRTTQQAEEASNAAVLPLLHPLCRNPAAQLQAGFRSQTWFQVQIVTIKGIRKSKTTLTFLYCYLFFLFFFFTNYIPRVYRKILNCVDKLLPDHQNSSSRLILLGNFSTVSNLGIYRSKGFITKKNPCFLSKIKLLWGFWVVVLMKGSNSLFSAKISVFHCQQLLSVSRETSQVQQDNKQRLFPHEIPVEDWFESSSERQTDEEIVAWKNERWGKTTV